MPLRTLKTYLDLCREHGVEPTWYGLRTFAALSRGSEKK